MKRSIAPSCSIVFLALAAGYGKAQPPAPTPGFTITANNVTMSNSGNNLVPFTLTSVNGFTGTINVDCSAPNPTARVKEPTCDPGPVARIYTIPANGTVSGEYTLVAYPVPSVSTMNRSTPGSGASWAAAGLLMLGFGLSRRRRFGSGRLLLTAGLLMGLTGMSACGGGPPTLTPGTYTYTFSANSISTPSPAVTTTFQVTVPAGIVLVNGIVG
jgi:MYXO-CTERM domain-containing protein